MPPSKNFYKFILIGLLTVFAGEFQVQVLAAQKGIGALFSTLLLYVFFLALMYQCGKFVDRKVSLRNRDVVYYLVGGVFGLAIEWTMGNGPWVGNGAIQAGMFAWWAATFLVPRIFATPVDDTIKPLRRKIPISLLLYAFISTGIVLLSPLPLRPAFAGILLAIGYIGINFQFIPYLVRNGFAPVFVRGFMWFLVIAGLAGLVI